MIFYKKQNGNTMKKTLFFISFIIGLISANAQQQQDLLPTVKVSDVQIQLTDKSVFRKLEADIKQFFSNYKWSTDKIANNESIEFYIEIQLKSYNQQTGEITAGAIIQSRRPVFAANYSTVLFSYNDDNFDFVYTEQQRLDFNENSYNNNLTSLLGFYAYYIIGLDYDSFGQEAGTSYYNKAFQVCSQAQQGSGSIGWKAFGATRTRYNLIDNILNERFRPMRQALYAYHRKGLDQFYKNPESARKQIFASLLQVQKVYKIAPNTVMLLVFFESKSDELVNIYKGATEIEKPKAIELLSEINVANISKYEKIRG